MKKCLSTIKFFVIIVFFTAGFMFFTTNSAHAANSGAYTAYFDGGEVNMDWRGFKFDKGSSSGSNNGSVKIAIASGSSNTAPPTFPTSGDCFIGDSGEDVTTDTTSMTPYDISLCAGTGQYLWYRAEFYSSDINNSPTLDNIAAEYFHIAADQYESFGTYDSGVISAQNHFGQKISGWGNLSWNACAGSACPSGGSISLKARSDDDGIVDDGSAPDWSTCSTLSSGDPISFSNCVTPGHQYLQYQAIFDDPTNNTESPLLSLDDVTIGYNYYSTSNQILYSSIYYTGEVDNIMGSIGWTEDSAPPDNTTTTLSLRTSSDGSAWGNWYDFDRYTSNCLGIDNCINSNGTIFYPTEILDAVATSGELTDGVNDQYFQYKVVITSDGSYTPTVSDVTVKYFTMEAPDPVVLSVNSNSIVLDEFIDLSWTSSQYTTYYEIKYYDPGLGIWSNWTDMGTATTHNMQLTSIGTWYFYARACNGAIPPCSDKSNIVDVVVVSPADMTSTCANVSGYAWTENLGWISFNCDGG